MLQELNDVFGDSDRPCLQSDLAQLKYLENCLKEALRLFPPVPIYERVSQNDVQIGWYLIMYKKKPLVINMYICNRKLRNSCWM